MWLIHGFHLHLHPALRHRLRSYCPAQEPTASANLDDRAIKNEPIGVVAEGLGGSLCGVR
jgi:hypothetical protein